MDTLAAPTPTAYVGTRPIRKALRPRDFVDFGTNAEMRWTSVRSEQYLT
ncbi:MAG: hypothetical protein JWO46_3155, partial [Nocardioidaceae bacterium]|nr:hypothetical protein [Nocardioidaceae bacterium]